MWDLLRRMFRDDRVALCGTALLAFDFMHLTQTRIATIDSFATLFILLMYLFLYRYFAEGRLRHLAACGVAFGVGAATKWTCLYARAGLGVLWALHWVFQGVQAHRDGDGRRYVRRLVANIGFCLVFFVLVPGMIYYASYYPYGAARGLHGAGMYFTREYAAIVLENQRFMFTYHAGLVATHPYASRWWQWLLDRGRSSTTCRMATGRCSTSARRQPPASAGAGCWLRGACVPRGQARPHGAVYPRRLSSRRCCRGCSSRA